MTGRMLPEDLRLGRMWASAACCVCGSFHALIYHPDSDTFGCSDPEECAAELDRVERRRTPGSRPS